MKNYIIDPAQLDWTSFDISCCFEAQGWVAIWAFPPPHRLALFDTFIDGIGKTLLATLLFTELYGLCWGGVTTEDVLASRDVLAPSLGDSLLEGSIPSGPAILAHEYWPLFHCWGHYVTLAAFELMLIGLPQPFKGWDCSVVGGPCPDWQFLFVPLSCDQSP